MRRQKRLGVAARRRQLSGVEVPGVAQVGTAHVRPGEDCLRHVGVVEAHVGNDRAAQVGLAQARTRQIGAAQRGALEVGADQRRVAQVGVVQQGVREVDGAAVDLTPLLLRQGERHAVEIGTRGGLLLAPLVPSGGPLLDPGQMAIAAHELLLDATRSRPQHQKSTLMSIGRRAGL